MKFDDHEIWGAPVREPELPVEPAALVPPPQSAGRLYRSAGSAPHPDAIVALPTNRQTAVHVIDATASSTVESPAAPSSAPVAAPTPPPVRVSSLQDPALASIVEGEPRPSLPAQDGQSFDDWFRNSGVMARIAPVRHSVTLPQPGSIGAGRFAAAVAVVTVGAALLSAFLTTSLLPGTGVALLVATAVGAWLLRPADRWAAWVLPSYLLITAVLVGGQFTDGAPGSSPVGQAMLVVTSLISLAPWLAATTLVGAVLPAVRLRRATPRAHA